jgi:CHAT domain-containing protein
MRVFLIFTLLHCFISFARAEPTTPQFSDLLQQGDAAFQRGQFEHATSHWEKALKLLGEGQPKQKLPMCSRLAAGYQNLGMHQQVFAALEQALNLANELNDETQQAIVSSQLSDEWLAIGDSEHSLKQAHASVTLARRVHNDAVLARSLNTLGNVLFVTNDFEHALTSYQEALQLAEKTTDQALQLKISLNLAKTQLQSSSLNTVYETTHNIAKLLRQLPDQHDKSSGYISLAMTRQDLLQADTGVKQSRQDAQLAQQDPDATDEEKQLSKQVADELGEEKGLVEVQRQYLLNQAVQELQTAANIAKKQQDHRTTSIAYGRLADIYFTYQKLAETTDFNRQALFFAKQGNYPDILYLWQWQQGALLKVQGQLDAAITAYQAATETLQPIQQSLDVGRRSSVSSFNVIVRPVYYELADLVLQKAGLTTDKAERQKLLKQARNTVESVKMAELRDYFQDECVLELQEKAKDLDQVVEKTAIIYPIPLEDRLVLLVSTGGDIQQITVDATSDEINDAALDLRVRLQTRPNNRFLYPARQLYDWVIRPLLPILQENQVDTLVIVPDGMLRLIPMSTLYDGKQFLIENYSLAITPGLTLINPRPIDWANSATLVAGLSDAVQGYPPLPSVGKELETIKTLTNGQDKLFNAEYTFDNLRDTLKSKEFSVLHLATHGEFSSDPDETYLLSYDGKVTMDKLQTVIGLGKFRNKPIELLTLSACRTAVGDERAALGLAGVAVKSGARSAIATLWFVDDEATALVITDFYREMRQNGKAKAKALQSAQKKLIAQTRYWHPSYWAPFLLIGNWL